MKLLLPVVGLLLLAPPAGAAEPIGRLFFTPEQRASLDVARSKRTHAAVATEKTEESAPAPGPETVTYEGLVRRSDGRNTVWLNNRAVSEKQAAESLVRSVGADGSVTLRAPQTGRDLSLKVGQSAELTSGTIDEAYARRPAPKPEAKPGAAVAPKPMPNAAAITAATREKEERERGENLDDAIRAMRDAANARSVTAPPQPPEAVPR